MAPLLISSNIKCLIRQYRIVLCVFVLGRLVLAFPLEMPVDRSCRNAEETSSHVLVAARVMQSNIYRFTLQFSQRGTDPERK